MNIEIHEGQIWYHGSDQCFDTLREGSTITPWRALAEALSHRPTRLSYDDHGAITHNGMADGFLYEIDEPLVIGRDICQHPRTTMDANAEFLTCRPLRVKLVERLSSGYDPLLGEGMRVMLTSCGLETEKIRQAFLRLLGKPPEEAHALFIPTAAIDAGAIAVLPKCMNDLLRCGIPDAQIRVFDLHESIPADELAQMDVVYLCGGRTSYLLERINRTGFGNELRTYIRNGGLVLGVSAGSLVFANNLPDNLRLVDARMDVHCDEGDLPGQLAFPLRDRIRLSNTAALIIRAMPGDAEIIDGE